MSVRSADPRSDSSAAFRGHDDQDHSVEVLFSTASISSSWRSYSLMRTRLFVPTFRSFLSTLSAAAKAASANSSSTPFITFANYMWFQTRRISSFRAAVRRRRSLLPGASLLPAR